MVGRVMVLAASLGLAIGLDVGYLLRYGPQYLDLAVACTVSLVVYVALTWDRHRLRAERLVMERTLRERGPDRGGTG